VLLVLALVAGLPSAVLVTPGRDLKTPGYIQYCRAWQYCTRIEGPGRGDPSGGDSYLPIARSWFLRFYLRARPDCNAGRMRALFSV